jgi:hypothetical protein
MCDNKNNFLVLLDVGRLSKSATNNPVSLAAHAHTHTFLMSTFSVYIWTCNVLKPENKVQKKSTQTIADA